MSHLDRRLTEKRYISKAAKALARAAFDSALLDTFDYDEYEVDTMRDWTQREAQARHAFDC